METKDPKSGVPLQNRWFLAAETFRGWFAKAKTGSLGQTCSVDDISGRVDSALPSLPDSKAAAAKWRVLSASVPGSSHMRRGLACQDFNRFRILSDGTLIIVVCDGAGSAQRASEGAYSAARLSVDFLAEHIASSRPTDVCSWGLLLRHCLDHVRSELIELATRMEGTANPSDFATTLLIAVLSTDFIATAQIGDGAIVTRRDPGGLSVLTEPGRNEYINETTFVTSPEYPDSICARVESAANVTGIAALTDGLQMLAIKFPDNLAHSPFFDPIFEFAAAEDSGDIDIEEFLRSDRVCDRTDDDKTLVIAVRL